MKSYIEILDQIKAEKAKIVDTAKTERELARQEMILAHKTGDEKSYVAARKAFDETESRYLSECVQNENVKIAIEILKDNAANAIFAESINTICSIWNKYAGKQRGEKTAEKIRKEMFSALGFHVSVGNKYGGANITIYFPYQSRPIFNDIEFYSTREDGKDIPALIDNKIQPISPEIFRVYCHGEYVEDVSAHVTKIREAHNKALESEKALEDAISAYNKLTRGNIQRASIREGVKHWFVD